MASSLPTTCTPHFRITSFCSCMGCCTAKAPPRRSVVGSSKELGGSTLQMKILNNLYPALGLWRSIQWQVQASQVARLTTWTESIDSHAWFIWEDVRATSLGLPLLCLIALDLGFFEIVQGVLGLINIFCLNLCATQAYKWGIKSYK
jgi:hypothetical protein